MEQKRQRVGSDADAAVFHGDGDGHLVSDQRLAGPCQTPDGHQHAAGIGELDGVADQIGHDLPQPHLVAEQHARHRGIDGPGNVDPLLVGLGRQQLHHALHAVLDRQLLGFQNQLVGLDLGEVEDFIDQAEQRARRTVDGPRIGLLLRRQLGLAQQAGHAENAVHRRADFVAHGGEEARLRPVGGLGLPARIGQLRLDAARFRDVAPQRLHLGHRAFAGGDRVLLPLEPARAGRSFDFLNVALMPDRRARSERACLVAGKHARAEGLPQHRCPLAPEHAAERLVHEREPPLGIPAQDDVRLVVEQVAVARLVLADLPLEVLEFLQLSLQPVADAHEALELVAKIAIGLERALRTRRRASVRKNAQCPQPAFQPARKGSETGHA